LPVRGFAGLDPVVTPADFGIREQAGQKEPFSGWPPRSRRGAPAVNQPGIGEFTDAPTSGGLRSWPSWPQRASGPTGWRWSTYGRSCS